MAEIETKDIDIEDYVFTPKEIEENGQKILDYTGVENDKVYLVNKKDILTKKRPAWLPEFDIEGLKKDSFLPVTVHDDKGNYYVQVNFKTGSHKETVVNRFSMNAREVEVNDYEQKVYKMNLDVLAASVDYYLKRERENLKAQGSSQKVSLPRGLNRMSSSRYDSMRQLLQFCDNYKTEDKSVLKKYGYRQPTSRTPEGFNKQSQIIFREQYAPLLQNLKDKKLDLNLQKQDYIDTHAKGEETSYGEKGSRDVLLADYGIKIKKQNGKPLSSSEIESIKNTVEKVWNHYGDFSDEAKNYNMILSYADNCNQHARKAAGLFNSYYNAIGVSFFRDGKNERISNPDVIFSHEAAHWFDCLKGKETHNWFASDKDGTLENKIALKYKELLRKKVRASKENLGDYWYRTCECFARSMEQDYAIKHGIKIDEPGYLPEDVYRKEIQPMVQELLEENRKYFNLSVREKNIEFLKDETAEEKFKAAFPPRKDLMQKTDEILAEEYKARTGQSFEKQENKVQENIDMGKLTKQEVIDDFIAVEASYLLRTKSEIDDCRYYGIRGSWEEYIADLKMSDAITEKQSESLLKEDMPCKEKDFLGFRIKLNAKMLELKEFDKKYNHQTVETEKQQVQEAEKSDITYFVKSVAEFDMFADFEPITGLTADEAVKKYAELQQKNIECGIGINIKGDSVFEDPDANGVTVLVRNNGKDTFNVYGDTFVKQLKEDNEHGRNVLSAFEELHSAAKKSGLDVEDAPFIIEKKTELFENRNNQVQKAIEQVINAENIQFNSPNVTDFGTDFYLFKPTAEYINAAKDSDTRFVMPVVTFDKNYNWHMHLEKPLISEPLNHDKAVLYANINEGFWHNFLIDEDVALKISSISKDSLSLDKNQNRAEEIEVENFTASQANSLSEEKYGFYFEFNNDENCADIFSSKDDDFVGSIGEGGFGYADDLSGNDPTTKIPENDFRNVISLAQKYYDESKREFEKSLDGVEEKFYSWNEIVENAMGKGNGDVENSAYNKAREEIAEYAKQFEIDIENAEVPEDEIDDFVKEHREISFGKDGNILIDENLKAPELMSDEDLRTVEKLSERDKEVLSCYSKNYDYLYNSDYQNEKIRAVGRDACYFFDDTIKSSPLFKFYINHLAEVRKDPFTSDREEAAVIFAIKELGLDKDLKLDVPDSVTKHFETEQFIQKTQNELNEDLNSVFEEFEKDSVNKNQSTFDNEIDDLIAGRLKSGHVFNLGKPGEILQKCGFPKDQRIELAEARLKMKATQGNHPFNLEDIKGLDKALQEPVGVFEYGNREKSQNVIVDLQKDGKNFLVGVFFNQKQRGYEVSDIRGLFNRDNIDWVRWIQQGKMIYGNKEKIQVLITQQRTNLAEVNNKEVRTSSDSYYLDSTENIMQNFGDVNDVFTSEFPEYAEQKERHMIYRAFNQIYQDLDSVEREDAVMQADEFYDALVNNDTKTIELYESGLLYNDIADKAKEIHQNFELEREKSIKIENVVAQSVKNPEVWKWTDYEDGSGSLKNPEGKEVAEYDLTTHEFKINNGWEQAYSYDGNKSHPWTAAEIKTHVEQALAITDKNIIHEKEPGLGEEQIVEEKLQKLSSMPLVFESVKKGKDILPFELIENKEKGRVNIKFNPAQKNPYFNDIIKELKSNGWKYAPSTQQWYPVKIEDSEKFAFTLQTKYSEKLNDVSVQDEMNDFILPVEVNKITNSDSIELSQDTETGKIRYFDRNYLENKEFTEYFNENLRLLKNEAAKISEKDAGTVLKALNHMDSGLAEYRSDRLGLDEDKNLVIVTHDKEKTSIRKTNLNELLLIAKEMSEKELINSKKCLEKYRTRNSKLDESLTDIFKNLYESCVEQSAEINTSMQKIFDDYYKNPEVEKSVKTKEKLNVYVKPLQEGDAIGKDTVMDVYPISKGVYQATLGQTSGNAVTSAASFFVIDENIAFKLRPELLELMEKHDKRYVVESKYNEPYVLKELIDKSFIPPRDADYVQKLEDFISSHPEKYAKLYPVNCRNFADSLRKLAVIDKDLHKNSFALGKQLLAMVEDSDKKKVSEWIIKQGGNTEENMKKLFSSWITGQAVEKDVAKTKQNNGYPPRGE